MSNLQKLFAPASAAVTVSGSSPQFPVGSSDRIFIDINLSALTGTAASVEFQYSRVGADGILYPVWQGGLSAAGPLSVSIGPGMEVARDPGATGVLTWTLAGTTPSATFSANVYAK